MRKFRTIRSLMLAVVMMALPAASFAGVFLSITVAPPALPVYTQPLCPGDGYIWTPGYWAYGDEGYYWVPGTWVEAPQVGFLWTPGYWGWGGGLYAWHGGYWGSHIGFYGGVNYGFGYGGFGYEGGYWDHGRFAYNRTVNNVNITNVHVYNKTVINNTTINRVSYNGPGGLTAKARPEELRAEHENHIQPTGVQAQHEQAARSNRQLLASVNHGRPAIAATAKPGDFSGHNVVAAKAAGAPYHPAAARTNSSTPRPENRATNYAPRGPVNSTRNSSAPHANNNNNNNNNNVPRPSNQANGGNAIHANESHVNASHQNAPRPQFEHNAPRPQNESHASAPRPQSPPQQSAPREVHTQSAPHPQGGSKPGGHEERPR